MSQILIVDDDEFFRSVLGLYLRTQGHDVHFAETGRDGVDAALRAKPDLVLTDFQMPQMDGFALFSALRSTPATARVPVVMITTHRSREMTVKALGLGFDGFLGKPFDPAELQKLIGELVSPGVAADLRRHVRIVAPTAARFTGSVVCCEICRLDAFALVLKKNELFEMLDRFAADAALAVEPEGGWLVKPDLHHLLVAFQDEPATPPPTPRALRGALKIVLAAQRLKPWMARRFAGRSLPEFLVGVGVHTGQVEARLPAAGNSGGIAGEAAEVARGLAESILSLHWSVVVSRKTAEAAGFAFLAGGRTQLHLPSHGTVDAIEVKGLAAPAVPAGPAQPDTLAEAAVERNATLVTYAAALPKPPAAPAAAVKAPRAKAPVAPAPGPTPMPADPFAGRTPVLKLADNGVVAVHLVRPRSGVEQQVVKTVLISDAKAKGPALRQFIERYAAFRDVAHPNIARTFEHGLSATHLFVAQEYCPGGDLRNVIAQGMDADAVIKALLRIAGALKAAHSKGFVHGDLKPSNVMIREDGSYALIDFALARMVEYAMGEGDTGVLLRSPSYLPPETITNLVADERSDIYTLGLLLHEMLTGRRAYDSPDLSQVMASQLNAPVPALPAAHARFQPLLDGLMAKNPADRFASVQEVIAFMMETPLQAADRAAGP